MMLSIIYSHQNAVIELSSYFILKYALPDTLFMAVFITAKYIRLIMLLLTQPASWPVDSKSGNVVLSVILPVVPLPLLHFETV